MIGIAIPSLDLISSAVKRFVAFVKECFDIFEREADVPFSIGTKTAVVRAEYATELIKEEQLIRAHETEGYVEIL